MGVMLMAVYITGDCHRDFRRFNTECFPEQKDMTRDDVVIIAGDCGLIWAKDERATGQGGWKEEQHLLSWLESKSFTLAFVDGNHENFDRLRQFPVKTWNGGLIHEIRPGIIHMMRGQVFTIGGKLIWTFGGASSHDIGSGIIDPDTDPRWRQKVRRFKKEGIRDYRIKGSEWWPEESFKSMKPEAVAAQKEEAFLNLSKVGWKVDYVITHTMPSGIISLICEGDRDADAHSDFLEEIHSRLEFKKWFGAHFHKDAQITEKDIVLYEQIIRIA